MDITSGRPTRFPPKLRPEDRHRIQRHGCEQTPPPELISALDQFNSGKYWECHETLEELWAREPRDVRYLYQGILLVGVGLLHLQRRNHHGALVKLRSGCELLSAFRPVCAGVDVEILLSQVQPLLSLLQDGPGRMEDAMALPAPQCSLSGR